MGIRVDADSLINQLEKSGNMDRVRLPFHQALLKGELPLTMGGGIGQSRLCMLLLNKAHVWPDMGIMFGEKSGRFIRLALACPRSVVEEVMNRIYKAING